MADTIDVIRLAGTSWENANTLSGIPAGTAITIQNQTASTVFLAVSSVMPSSTFRGYVIPPDTSVSTPVSAGESAVWLYGTGKVSIQPVTERATSVVSLPLDLYTSNEVDYRRLKVEPEQSSFVDNHQFRYFESFHDVPYGSQVVYYFQTVNPVNIVFRKLDLYQGGREYLVYGTTGVTFTGTLGSPLPIHTVNNNLKPSNITHPVSGVTVRKAVGAGIFSSTATPPHGTICLTDGNSNRASATYAPNDQKSGVAAGQSFYLVLNHIGSNNNTSGQITVLWEELFG